MNFLLSVAKAIDWLNDRIGRAVYWLVLLAVLVSAVNATIRYTLNTSSNAWLEIQWYLFAAVFLLASGYTLLNNEHIRIDVIIGRFSRRTQAWIDLFGHVFFLLPMAIIILWLSWPVFVTAYTTGEISSDAGGLIRWPARLMLPVGFALLTLQGFSQVIKTAAFLMGLAPDPVEPAPAPHANTVEAMDPIENDFVEIGTGGERK